jgi:hypothetical protein
MKRRRASAIAMTCLLLTAQGILFAEDQAPDQNAPRRLLVAIEKSWLPGYSNDEMAILQRSLLTALSEAEGGPSPVAYALKGFPSSQQDRNKAARNAGADCWLYVKISGFKFAPSIRVISFDLIYDMTTLDFSFSRSEAFPMMDISQVRWDEIVDPVAKKYPPLGQLVYSRGPPAPVTLTLRALPGTRISGLSPKPLLIGSDGTVTIDLPSPAPYSFRTSLSGYIPNQMGLYLDGQTEIAVNQVKSPWLYLDASFYNGFYPGISATYAAPFFPAFVRVGFTTFRAGLAVNQDAMISSLPLSQLTLLLGMYFSPEDSPTRFYAGAGPLLRVTLPPGGSFTIDHLLPWGVQLVAGWEFSLAGNLRIFIENAPTGYYTPEPDLFRYSFGSSNVSFPFLNFPPLLALNLLEVRFGIRWML